MSSLTMDNRLRRWLPSVTLVALALGAGAGWRMELELRGGWAGLAWLGYFHWAVPVFVGGFVLWSAVFGEVERRTALLVTLVGFSIGAYLLCVVALGLFFATGPSAAIASLQLGMGNIEIGLRRFEVAHWAILVIWPLIPIAFCHLLRRFGTPITPFRAMCSSTFFVLSWPVAVFVRGFFERSGSSDLIHALKSGFVVPFLVVSLGIPLLRFPAFPGLRLPRTESN